MAESLLEARGMRFASGQARKAKSSAAGILGLMAFLVSGCVPLAQFHETPAINGVVLSGDDGLPVAHATVWVDHFDKGARTDSSGRFRIEPETHRRLVTFLFPGATVTKFHVTAWHEAGAHGAAHLRAVAVAGSFGYAATPIDLIVVLIDEEVPPDDAFSQCPPLSGTADYTARLLNRLEFLQELDEFRRARTFERASRLEESIRKSLFEYFEECDLDEEVTRTLLNASRERQWSD